MRELVARGAVEINLVAQDLTPTAGTSTASCSWRRWCGGLGARRRPALGAPPLHLSEALDDELIEVIAEEPRVAKYVDMPLQHIADAMLKRMRRGHVGKTSRELVERMRARIPGVTLRTTFIVGHPGETDAEFDELFEFVREAALRSRRRVHLLGRGGHARRQARRRARRGAGRRRWSARRRELMRVQRAISRKKMKAMVGRELDGARRGAERGIGVPVQGRHEGQAPEIDGGVFLALADGVATPRQGEVVSARVTGYADYDLAATIERTIAPTRMKRAPTRLPVFRSAS